MSKKQIEINSLKQRIQLLYNKKLYYQKIKVNSPYDTIIIKESLNNTIQQIDNFINDLTLKLENIESCKKCKYYNQCDHLGSYYKEGKWCFE